MAHHPDCESVRGRIDLVPAHPNDRRCRRCAGLMIPATQPNCVVCLVDLAPGPLTGCPHGHGMCDACMGAHAAQHASSCPEIPLHCPCGDGAALDLHRDLSADTLSTYVRTLGRAVRDATVVKAPVYAAGMGVALCDDARALRCPTCGRRFIEFDGCAALQCICGQHFCALCLCKAPSAVASHQHVMECKYNPNPDKSYYVEHRAYQRVWTARARARLQRALYALAATDGRLFACSAMRSAWRCDPTLVTWRQGFLWISGLYMMVCAQTLLYNIGVGTMLYMHWCKHSGPPPT